MAYYAVAQPTTAELLAEIERLRTLLDKAPSCLMRVGLDGTLLAVTDVALDLLGGRTLADVLGKNFVAFLRGADSAPLWAGFVQRVTEGGSGSAECEMQDLAGNHRDVMLLGGKIDQHPDGVASLLVVVRDLTTARKLEASLLEHEGVRRQLIASFAQMGQSLGDAMDAATLINQVLKKNMQ